MRLRRQIALIIISRLVNQTYSLIYLGEERAPGAHREREGARGELLAPNSAPGRERCQPLGMATITCNRFTEEYQLFEELGK